MDLFKVFVIIPLVMSLSSFSLEDSDHPIKTDMFSSDGHIEVLGDFLIANTNESDITIREIVLSGTENYTLASCGSNKCIFNINHVEPGVYMVTLYGSEGFEVVEMETIR